MRKGIEGGRKEGSEGRWKGVREEERKEVRDG